MADAQPLKPTDAELEILQVLWQNGPTTVRFVNDELNKTKEVGYTTTLKIMQLMTEKNMVRRDESSRSHVYEALLKEEATQQHLLNKFLDSTFRGSASKLVMQALGNHQTTPEELNQIRDLLNKLEGGTK
jgi:BlaI family transcriptional regulator, penicillinase repressor